MQRHLRRLAPAIILIVLVILALAAGAALAQDKVYRWDRFDVDINILATGDFQVTETQTFRFVSGSFSYVYANIPLDRVEEITNVEVWEGNQRYTLSGSGAAGTYSVSQDGKQLNIEWHFTPTANAARTWSLRYLVKGGLRIYDGGDQLYWKAIPPDHAQPILASTIRVHLPTSLTAEQLKIATYGASATWQQTDAQTIVFNASGQIPANRELEVRVQFPHGIVPSQAPAWQAADDRQRAFQSTWGPIINLGVLVLSIVIALGGAAGLYLLWYARGRDKPAGLVAEYITEPPTDAPPAVAGTLIDESADMADIVATIVDLARRGVITMQETEEPGILGFGKKKDFVYRLVKAGPELAPFERRVLTGMFGAGTERRLSDLREKFYRHIPDIQSALYAEVVQRGYFRRSPKAVRGAYSGLAIVGLIVAGVIGFMGLGWLQQYTSFALCLPLSISAVGVGLLIISRFMPARTAEGSEANAKWRAFKRYLENIEKYTNVAEAKELFDKYLPYAIAFGLEKSWIDTFSQAGAPAPGWYLPPIIIGGGPYRRASTDWGAGGSLGPIGMGSGGAGSAGGMPSLDSMSAGMSRSLSSMSEGLFSMLNSASSTLSSAPRSSGGGGGGGFSGGGGGGGGGGGRGAG